jgi:hypothetical protein
MSHYFVTDTASFCINFFFLQRDAAGMTDNDMRSYIKELGKLGFAWQFITLGGLHANALATGKYRYEAHEMIISSNNSLFQFSLLANFAKGYAEHGMLAYVAGVQRKEREAGVDVLQHQVCTQRDHAFSSKMRRKFRNASSFTNYVLLLYNRNGVVLTMLMSLSRLSLVVSHLPLLWARV